MQVRLKDIADRLGVSAMTVSRALRDTSGEISDETRNRIRKTAIDMGYRVNASARAMRRGRYDSLAFFCSRHYAYDSRRFLDMLSSRIAAKSNHLVLPKVLNGDDLNEALVSELLRDLSVDGLFIDVHQEDVSFLRPFLAKLNMPHVWMNVFQNTDSIYVDEQGGAAQLTQELIARGHTKIAFAILDTGFRVMHAPEGRESGYCKAMEAAGLQPMIWTLPDWVGDDLCLRSGSVEAAVSYKMCEDEPSAIIAYDLETAGPIVMCLKDYGWKLPADVELVSFHDEVQTPLGDSILVMQIPTISLVDAALGMMWAKLEGGADHCESVSVSYDMEAFRERINRVFPRL